jgi:hypothetical protein
VALFGLALPARAQDGGDASLYAAAPPPGSAFVRVVNLGSAPAAVQVADRALGSIASGALSPYVPVPKGDVRVTAAGRPASVTVDAGKFYTAVFGAAAGTPLLADPAPPALNKAGLVFYNLTDTAGVGLTTADGAVTVLTGVGPMAVAGREVNALNVGFAVSGVGTVAPVPAVQLARGRVYSLVVRRTAAGAVATLVENQTTTAK